MEKKKQKPTGNGDSVEKAVERALKKVVVPEFERIDKRLDGHDKRFVGIDKRFDASDAKFDRMFTYMERRFDEQDKRFDAIDEKLNEMMGYIDHQPLASSEKSWG